MSQHLAFLTQITAVWPSRIVVIVYITKSIITKRIIAKRIIVKRIIVKRIIVFLICMQTKIENEVWICRASLKVVMSKCAIGEELL